MQDEFDYIAYQEAEIARYEEELRAFGTKAEALVIECLSSLGYDVSVTSEEWDEEDGAGVNFYPTPEIIPSDDEFERINEALGRLEIDAFADDEPIVITTCLYQANIPGY